MSKSDHVGTACDTNVWGTAHPNPERGLTVRDGAAPEFQVIDFPSRHPDAWQTAELIRLRRELAGLEFDEESLEIRTPPPPRPRGHPPAWLVYLALAVFDVAAWWGVIHGLRSL